MKEKLFRQATTLVISSFVVFLSQASVIASNNQKITITDHGLGKSESIIAQLPDVTPANDITVGAAVAIALDVLGQSVTIAESRAVSNSIDPTIAPLVRDALGEASGSFATAQSSAESGEFANVAQAVVTGVNILTPAITQAVAVGDTETAQAIAQVVLNGQNAAAVAQAVSGI